MKLHELPKGAKIVAEISDGSTYCIFDHVDGIYSYCETEKGGIINLSRITPLKKVGEHYEIDDQN